MTIVFNFVIDSSGSQIQMTTMEDQDNGIQEVRAFI